MGSKRIYKHVLTPEGERWEFRRTLAANILVLGVFIITMLAALALVFSLKVDPGGVWTWIVLELPPWLFVGFLVWMGLGRSIPLTVDRGGRVCFGKRELCRAGVVRAVLITTGRPKASDWEVYLALDHEESVSVPPHYFGDYELGEHAVPLAEELAKALGVGIIESA